jgi:hypothetical protein
MEKGQEHFARICPFTRSYLTHAAMNTALLIEESKNMITWNHFKSLEVTAKQLIISQWTKNLWYRVSLNMHIDFNKENTYVPKFTERRYFVYKMDLKSLVLPHRKHSMYYTDQQVTTIMEIVAISKHICFM